MYQIVVDNMILHIVNDIQTLSLYEKNFPNWMNSLFLAIKNKKFTFHKLDSNLYDFYRIFIMNDLMSNFNVLQMKNINYEYIKSTYFE